MWRLALRLLWVALLSQPLLLAQAQEIARSPAPDQPETFSHRPEFATLVPQSDGTILHGVSLKLCRIDDENRAAAEKPCRTGVAEENGEFVFREVPPGHYLLTGELDEYALVLEHRRPRRRSVD